MHYTVRCYEVMDGLSGRPERLEVSNPPRIKWVHYQCACRHSLILCLDWMAMTEQTRAPGDAEMQQRLWWLLFACWLIALMSTAGSLFFSEVMGLVPCELCWYQRLCMFPLTVILAAALHPLDLRVIRYALLLAVIGLIFTLYHCLLFYGFIPESLQPCQRGISCADDSMILMGFLPIPLLSLVAFTVMIVLLLKTRALAGRMTRI